MKKNRLLSERKQPNLVCLCIDRNQDGEIGGKIYNRYSRAPELFDNVERRGRYATFLVAVRYNENAIWQGDLYWVEKRQEKKFKSVLELLILIDNILFTKEKENRLREKW